MDRLRYSEERLPSYLYRVLYPLSQTYETERGLFAQDRSSFFDERHLDAFRKAVTKQFTWKSRHQAPFISLFSNKEHATSWARKRSEETGYDYEILTVRTAELQENYVFKVETLIQHLDVQIPGRAIQHRDGAYLCLHHIPSRAIDSESVWIHPEDREQVRESKIRTLPPIQDDCASDELLQQLRDLGIS